MTIPELKAQFYADRLAMIEAKAAERKTQTEAARELGVSLQFLNRIVHSEGIHWPVIRQGPRR